MDFLFFDSDFWIRLKDISFNPQDDRQAEDRCHRLGQEKEVTIYKMIAADTVDEHILQLSRRKAELNDEVLEEVPSPSPFFFI